MNEWTVLISEGSCDTEDWSNDAENSALHHRNKWHFFFIYSNKNLLFQIVIIFHNIVNFNADLVSERDIKNPNY